MATEEHKLVTQRIGLLGAVGLLVGTAVGMSIFVVPTQMAASAGPSVVPAVLLSIVPMTLGVLLLLQLGGAIPVAGGIYVYGSRLVGPFWGLVSVTVPVLAVWSYLLFAALGFSQYLNGIVGGAVPQVAAVWGLLGGFLVLNYFGIRMVTKVQLAAVGVLILGMLTFIVGGLLAFDPANVTPVFPDTLFAEGLAPFFLAVVLLYIPFQGFGMIIEIGEELENPVKNIPRVLAVGMGIVSVLTIGVIVTLVGAVPWQATVDPATGQAYAAGLAAVAGDFLPTPAVLFIAIAALVAAATTVNTLYTSYSRTVMRAARDHVVPGFLAEVHESHDTPYRAVLALGIPPILVAPLVPLVDTTLLAHVDILDWLVVVVVSGIFVAFMLGGVALWNLPKTFPERYEHSFYRLPMPVLKVVAVGNVVVSAVFTLLVAASAPSALGVVAVTFALTYVAYRLRVRSYAKRGIDLKVRMARLHDNEELSPSDD
jgi:APA family basic amino acid/polyamine antiporter